MKAYFPNFQLLAQLSLLFPYGIGTRTADVILGAQGKEGHVCSLLNLMLAAVAASYLEGHPLSVLLRRTKTFLRSVTHLNLCWRFSLSAEGKQAGTWAAPSCSQFELNMKRSLHKDAEVETRLSTGQVFQKRCAPKLRIVVSYYTKAGLGSKPWPTLNQTIL